METITVGSLFSGIGGIDLGLERAGMSVVWNSEIDPYACEVLKKHWPNVPNLGDIKGIDWRTVPKVDVIAGGYPCQPFSNIRRDRKGILDERYLWDYIQHAVSIVRPRVAFFENVEGHLRVGFNQVLEGLASIGYDAEWDMLPASAFGAPHQRKRLIVLAYSPLRDEQHSVPLQEKQTSETVVHSWEAVARNNRWETEPTVDRVADGVPNRMDRIRGLGNAVVPQVAEYVGNMISSRWGKDF